MRNSESRLCRYHSSPSSTGSSACVGHTDFLPGRWLLMTLTSASNSGIIQSQSYHLRNWVYFIHCPLPPLKRQLFSSLTLNCCFFHNLPIPLSHPLWTISTVFSGCGGHTSASSLPQMAPSNLPHTVILRHGLLTWPPKLGACPWRKEQRSPGSPELTPLTLNCKSSFYFTLRPSEYSSHTLTCHGCF